MWPVSYQNLWLVICRLTVKHNSFFFIAWQIKSCNFCPVQPEGSASGTKTGCALFKEIQPLRDADLISPGSNYRNCINCSERQSAFAICIFISNAIMLYSKGLIQTAYNPGNRSPKGMSCVAQSHVLEQSKHTVAVPVLLSSMLVITWKLTPSSETLAFFHKAFDWHSSSLLLYWRRISA